MNIILPILLFVALSIHAQTVSSSNLSGLGGSGAANTGGQTGNSGSNATTQNQQGGSVATLTATTINNGYSQGRPIRVGGTSVRLNLRLLPQQRQQITTYKQYRINLRLGRHGYIQPNNNNTQSGNNTQTGNNGNSNTNSSGSSGNSGTGGNNSSGQGNQTNQQGGVTTGGGTTGGTTGETTGGGTTGSGTTGGSGIPTGAVGMQAQGSVRK